MSEVVGGLAVPHTATSTDRIARPRQLSLGARLALGWEIVKGGLVELWSHKLRSTLTLTLLMLGVFALVVMSSVLDGVMDKIAMGFSGMSWDGTIMLAPDSPATCTEVFFIARGMKERTFSFGTVRRERSS